MNPLKSLAQKKSELRNTPPVDLLTTPLTSPLSCLTFQGVNNGHLPNIAKYILLLW